MWKFWKKPEKPKTKIDKLSEKVDKTVAGTEKILRKYPKPGVQKVKKVWMMSL